MVKRISAKSGAIANLYCALVDKNESETTLSPIVAISKYLSMEYYLHVMKLQHHLE